MQLRTNALATKQATDMIAVLTAFKLHGYGGTPPATAAALAGALGTPAITYQAVSANLDGKYGLKWAAPVAQSRVAARDTTQAAQGVAASSTNLTYVVLAEQDDTLAADTAKYRLVASVGTSGADIILDSVAVVSGTTYAFSSPVTITF